MNTVEACNALYNGKKIHNTCWDKDTYICYKDGQVLDNYGNVWNGFGFVVYDNNYVEYIEKQKTVKVGSLKHNDVFNFSGCRYIVIGKLQYYTLCREASFHKNCQSPVLNIKNDTQVTLEQ